MSAKMMLRSGAMVDLLEPNKSKISLEDVAWGLSGLLRYNAQSHLGITVAEHCVHVGRFAAHLAGNVSARAKIEARIGGLLHDAAEALTGDLIRPMKSALLVGAYEYARITKGIEYALCAQNTVDPNLLHCSAVVRADNAVLFLEAVNWGNWDITDWELPEEVRRDAVECKELFPARPPLPRDQACSAWFMEICRYLTYLRGERDV